MMKTRELILQAALDVFVEKGFRGASTAEISHRAGIATGSLFYHFSSKDILYQTLYITVRQRFLDDLLSHVEHESGLQERFKKIWFAASRWCYANQPQYIFLKSIEAAPSFSHLIAPSVEGNSDVIRKLFQDEVDFEISLAQWHLLGCLIIGMHEGFVRFILNDAAAHNQEVWCHTSYMMCWQALCVALPELACPLHC